MSENEVLKEGTYELVFGDSFYKFRSHRGDHHTIRYDFKPASVDASMGVIEFNEEAVTLTHPTIANSSQSDNSDQGIVYKGNKRPANRECIIIVDNVNKKLIFERISSAISLKRSVSSSCAQVTPPTTVFATSARRKPTRRTVLGTKRKSKKNCEKNGESEARVEMVKPNNSSHSKTSSEGTRNGKNVPIGGNVRDGNSTNRKISSEGTQHIKNIHNGGNMGGSKSSNQNISSEGTQHTKNVPNSGNAGECNSYTSKITSEGTQNTRNVPNGGNVAEGDRLVSPATVIAQSEISPRTPVSTIHQRLICSNSHNLSDTESSDVESAGSAEIEQVLDNDLMMSSDSDL